jgi:hypothetical protein
VSPLLPCIWSILEWGLSANFLPISSWQVAQVSLPTKSEAGAVVAWGSAVFPLGVCAPIALAHSRLAHNRLAPSVLAHSDNIRKARDPGLFPRTAPIKLCAVGLTLCMKNTALGALIAFPLSSMAEDRLSNVAFVDPRAMTAFESSGHFRAEAARVRSTTT